MGLNVTIGDANRIFTGFAARCLFASIVNTYSNKVKILASYCLDEYGEVLTLGNNSYLGDALKILKENNLTICDHEIVDGRNHSIKGDKDGSRNLSRKHVNMNKNWSCSKQINLYEEENDIGKNQLITWNDNNNDIVFGKYKKKSKGSKAMQYNECWIYLDNNSGARLKPYESIDNIIYNNKLEKDLCDMLSDDTSLYNRNVEFIDQFVYGEVSAIDRLKEKWLLSQRKNLFTWNNIIDDYGFMVKTNASIEINIEKSLLNVILGYLEDSVRKMLNNRYYVELNFMCQLIRDKKLQVEWLGFREDQSFNDSNIICDQNIILCSLVDLAFNIYTLRWKKNIIYGYFIVMNYKKNTFNFIQKGSSPNKKFTGGDDNALKCESEVEDWEHIWICDDNDKPEYEILIDTLISTEEKLKDLDKEKYKSVRILAKKW
ncbi:hypothetical protein RhiirA4_481674 [Rhizophagus irregularis]|uniref:Uncharacterized protein n=1 Tax=Rhizophagus irregularis TaxID=588596 RepID=A0A2I1HJX3_9GLOM|nr:hypothetical protein RhiirA4_481674 [Rhizophagus irregularis]